VEPIQRAAVRASPELAEAPGANLLLSDLRVAYLLLNELRYRSVGRVFGLSRDQANVLTAVILLMLAQAVHDNTVRLLGAPGAPSAHGTLLSAAGVSGALSSVAGAPASAVPGAGALLGIAVLGAAMVPAARSLHALRTESHRLTTAFHHRYGYLIDPGHWRQRQARRRGEPLPPVG
jgi:hypothetical protein